MQNILKYFPDLTSEQIDRFEKIVPLYRELNTITNVIPRTDVDSLFEKHILHSLAIAKIVRFSPGSRILDVGTGGGFPGIPLAIFFPDCQFVLIDPIAKRIKVVQAIADELELKNVTAIRSRVEDVREEFDFVASRAVTAFPHFVGLVKKNISDNPKNTIPNGIIYLKGGCFEDEITDFKYSAEVINITNFFSEPYFETKKVVYLPVSKGSC
jgi:16S rRNA (guanine527-N7)-methyltransferase